MRRTPRNASASSHLAKRPEQREVKRRAYRLRSHRPCQLQVSFELRTVALDFLREKPSEITALVRARLVVDHPADAGLIDEAAIDLDVTQPATTHSAQLPFAVRLVMGAAQDPAAALVSERLPQCPKYHFERPRLLA